MAQSARVKLRMQKELKLLMSDPPPGVLLNISEDENTQSSLSCVEATIKGPEGTVYSNGYFAIKIQIPERYPFQPPTVTFLTPIYHPNIDSGGRICLDILNLPPKGAWQPSLNISTILTSIGLLLSEPNPDDGLMAEISREYKYNRQIFYEKATFWTEKYAKPSFGVGLKKEDQSIEEIRESQKRELEKCFGNSDSSCGKPSFKSETDKVGDSESKKIALDQAPASTIYLVTTNEECQSRKKLCSLRQKLTLKPAASGNQDGGGVKSVIPADALSISKAGTIECSGFGPMSSEPFARKSSDEHEGSSDDCCLRLINQRGCKVAATETDCCLLKNESGSIEAIIVSDSEESGDESDWRLRSRMFMRKRYGGTNT